jgi:hypothetical protein
LVQFTPVTREQHGGKAWRRPDNYSFATTEAFVPVVGTELAQAARTMPIAFLEQSGSFMLVAVLSLAPNQNWFVGPNGQWLGTYIPALFRAYPFRMLRKSNSEDLVLCVAEEAALAGNADGGGEAFFDADGNLTASVRAVVDFLGHIERNRIATTAAVSALAEVGAIRPWEIKVKAGEKEQAITGLCQTNEAAMGALSDEAFLRLRKMSALPVAYAQLLSTGQIGIFEHLSKLRNQLTQPAAALPESLDKVFELPSDDVVQFS